MNSLVKSVLLQLLLSGHDGAAAAAAADDDDAGCRCDVLERHRCRDAGFPSRRVALHGRAPTRKKRNTKNFIQQQQTIKQTHDLVST